MEKKRLIVISYTFLIVFYFGILMYFFIKVLHANTFKNFTSALFFEIIGLALLAYFVIGGFIFKPIKVGFYPALLGITIFYTIILHIFNFTQINNMSNEMFNLGNLVILFIYFMISIPMYIVGKR